MVLGKKWPLSLFLVLSVLLPLTSSALAEPSQAESLLAQMTTEEKIAQLLMPAFYYYRTELGERRGVSEMRPAIESLLQRHAFGGIIFNLQNAQDNEKAVRLVDAFQTATASTPGRPQLITCTDQEGGYVTRLGKGTQMPGNMALGAVDSIETTELAARLAKAEETLVYVLVRAADHAEAAQRLRAAWQHDQSLYQAVGQRLLPLPILRRLTWG